MVEPGKCSSRLILNNVVSGQVVGYRVLIKYCFLMWHEAILATY